jgi:hypothetical protein
MSAELLREAAALMRERAEAAAHDLHEPASDPRTWRGIGTGYREPIEYRIASWHPAVALAAADWLEAEARQFDVHMRAAAVQVPEDIAERAATRLHRHGIAVARAYLGRDA